MIINPITYPFRWGGVIKGVVMARRLKNHGDVRRFLAATLNKMEKGDSDPQLGARLAYVASILLKAMEHEEMAERLKRIEEALNGIRRND